jgi:hypothetical protein
MQPSKKNGLSTVIFGTIKVQQTQDLSNLFVHYQMVSYMIVTEL